MSNKPIEKRYWGIDGEYHSEPDPKAAGRPLYWPGHVPGANAEEQKKLDDALAACAEADKAREAEYVAEGNCRDGRCGGCGQFICQCGKKEGK